ncbi:endophilin-A isoform X5 [Leptopilina boulardi]|uniref:endophilin-A isoform X5 n=1 Tax=Leptopilina boulardi TaxID=63433 RepID=UPI0021F68388|nr:endophilin-A isoform X5 [Leptopilina boulardi]
MAFAGLKKQINKANQYMTEKMGGAEGTKLDVDFVDMERKTDVTNELVEDLQMKTKEFLQPNPTARAKMAAVKGIGKLSGQAKASTYPQPEGTLGDCMLMYGKKMGEDSIFAQSLIEMGEAMKQMADVKYSLDDNIQQNFLEPLHHLQTKDLKEVMHHRKKLQGRRLDFDCKRRRQAKDDEIRMAEEKFAESLHLAQMGMFNLLENDVEQVAQLATFSEGLLEYHQQCVEVLRVLTETLLEKKDEAANRPKMNFVPKTLADLHVDTVSSEGINGASRAGSPVSGEENKRSQLELFPAGNPPQSANASPLPSPSKSPARTPMAKQPCCTALYDFEPENPGELGFKENDSITLIQKIDDNWFEGTVNGRTGYFPVSYVQVVVPLP